MHGVAQGTRTPAEFIRHARDVIGAEPPLAPPRVAQDIGLGVGNHLIADAGNHFSRNSDEIGDGRKLAVGDVVNRIGGGPGLEQTA